MIAAVEPEVWGYLAFCVWVAFLFLLGVGLSRAAGRRRPRREPATRVEISVTVVEQCSRCIYPGTLVRRERCTDHLVKVCVGHAAEGDRKNWWTHVDPFDQDVAEVLQEARRITLRASS